MRPARAIPLSFIVASLFLSFVLLPALSGPAFGETLLQCMEECIRHEGGNTADNKDTCKSRCAGAVMGGAGGGPGGKRDCMGEFKACRSKCGILENKCQSACKAVLTSCK